MEAIGNETMKCDWHAKNENIQMIDWINEQLIDKMFQKKRMNDDIFDPR